MDRWKKIRRSSPEPDDVIAGRIRPEPRELVALIRRVNPTGLGLNPKETARRYAQKSRLQSLLITRFAEDIEVGIEAAEPGVVSLRHRPSGLDACHAVIAELDDEARSWVQRLVDMDLATGEPPLDLRPSPQARPINEGHEASSRAEERSREGSGSEEDALSVPGFLLAGQEAVEAFDYETARTRFEAALAQSGGGAEPGAALLSLLVDHLGADEDALAVEERLSVGALAEPDIRVLLALAAARRSERERALRFLRHGDPRGGVKQGSVRRAEPAPSRIAEVFLALARASLAAGQLEEAAEDIARARERDPGRSELRELSDALAKARASARAPAEEELSRVFAGGDIAGASIRVRELLARWPDSDVGRRIARAVEVHRRQEQIGERLASAREALARGETVSGLALLREALACGLEGEDAAWAKRRIAAIEEEARAQQERARIEEVQHLIASGDLPRGLPAYAALDPAQRRALRESTGSPPLLWLEELTEPGAGLKAKAAIPAVLALLRATEIASREPSAALDVLDAHTKVLQGFEPAEEVRREARRALAELRRSAARRGVEAAQRALVEGEPDRADESLREAPLADLPADERAAADALWASVRKLLERRVLDASLAQSRREGDDLRAIGVLEKLLPVADATETSHFEALRSELRAAVQRKFCVHVEDLAERTGSEPPDTPTHAATNDPLWDAEFSAWLARHKLLPAKNSRGLADHALVTIVTSGCWVFLRLIDVASGRPKTRVVLRTPIPIEMCASEILGRSILVVGKYGSLLEISLDTFHVERWCPNVLLNRDARSSSPPTEVSPLHGLPHNVIETAALAPDGRSLWLTTITYEEGKRRHALHVLDLAELRLIREIHEPRCERVYIRPVTGLHAPRVAIVRSESQFTRLLDSRGLPLGELVKGMQHAPQSITACPDGERIFTIVANPERPFDPQDATWGWVEITQGVPSSFRALAEMKAVQSISAITSLSAKMTFALFEIEHEGCALFALRDSGAELEIAYRTTLPRRSMLLGDPSSLRAAVLLASDDRIEIVELGAEPPAHTSGPADAVFHFPRLPGISFHTEPPECYKPTGARLTAATALSNTIRRESSTALLRRLDAAFRRGKADELLNLEAALLLIPEPVMAGHVSSSAWERFPEHPRVRLSHTERVIGGGQWKETRELLDAVDTAKIDKGEVKHLHHLRGIALMMLDEPEAALVDLKQAEACDEGTCEVGDLIAICTPLSDTSRAWTPEQALLRDLMTKIVSADADLARGDATSARRTLDCLLVWEAFEIQSFARLAEACLLEEEAGAARDPFWTALTLLSYCDIFERMGTVRRREIPLPRASWAAERLAALAERARARAEAMLTQAATTAQKPPG